MEPMDDIGTRLWNWSGRQGWEVTTRPNAGFSKSGTARTGRGQNTNPGRGSKYRGEDQTSILVFGGTNKRLSRLCQHMIDLNASNQWKYSTTADRVDHGVVDGESVEVVVLKRESRCGRIECGSIPNMPWFHVDVDIVVMSMLSFVSFMSM